MINKGLQSGRVIKFKTNNMKKCILFLLLLSGILAKSQTILVVHAPGFHQYAKAGARPYYMNKQDPSFLCDDVEDRPECKDYIQWIDYKFQDTINHPRYSCGNMGNYSFRRYKESEVGAHYCDMCNKRIQVYYYPKDSIIEDQINY